MILRKIIPILIVYTCLPSSAPAQTGPSSTVEHIQDFSEVVVPIASVKMLIPSVGIGITGKLGPTLGMEANLGTGFCLDAECRFIVTNYHVAAIARPHRIKREKIIQRYLATGPHDEGATVNNIPNVGMLPFAWERDIAIFELQRPLPHHHGLTFSLDELGEGQEVDIYGYPKGIINPIRKLTRFPATFKGPTTSGLLAFDFELSGQPIRIGGASGGIVVDRGTEKIIGILCGSNETTAVAVPTQTLVDFVSKVQPFLAERVFPTANDVPPVPADFYPKFAPSPDHNSKFVSIHVDGLQHRPDESIEVKVLRKKAQLLADSMRNFIAVQSFSWGSGDKEEPAAEGAYEVRVLDGYQRFRQYPDGKKEFQDVPLPPLNHVVGTGGEWSELPNMVGTELGLTVHQAADVVVNDRRMKVFQYRADIEDGVCSFKSTSDFVFLEINKVFTVACYGEVWTDEDTNILRISEHYELPGKWKNYQGVVTYGWFQKKDEPPRLIPLTIYTQAERKGRVYWCRGQFTNYQRFDSEVRIIANGVQSLPPR
ncbi:MAG: hypothetical protein DMG48_02880 [Acidobacteria bacterium]|nr:MAG: hypothetical protein DMG48_02880 [Acidobacteriota bacterium]